MQICNIFLNSHCCGKTVSCTHNPSSHIQHDSDSDSDNDTNNEIHRVDSEMLMVGYLSQIPYFNLQLEHLVEECLIYGATWP